MKRYWGIIGALILLGAHVACGSEDDTSSLADDTSPDASAGDASDDARIDTGESDSGADASDDSATTDADDGSANEDAGFDAGYCYVNASDPLSTQDLDGDGFSVAMGDCNDCTDTIRPGVGCP